MVKALPILVCLILLTGAARAESWPTRGHNNRRTGQSTAHGPVNASSVHTFTAEEGLSINIAPTVDSTNGALFGTWGVIRAYGEEDPRNWNKFDGRLYSVDGTDASSTWSTPFAADFVHYCYDYQGRVDEAYCPEGGTVSYYNGTVEGTAVLSDDESTVFFGRGDGKVYAVHRSTGEHLWTFSTFNPVDPADPDGGGEVIAGLLLAPDGTLYFPTVSAGPYETNALYAVDTGGQLRWRYPAASASLPQIFFAAPALSPDGTTLYVAGSWGPAVDNRDITLPGTVYAFDIAAGSGSGEDRLKWTYNPVRQENGSPVNVWSNILVVGSDGALYLGGSSYTEAWGTAVVFALHDRGDYAEPAWDDYVDIDRNKAAITFGLAVREEGGVTTRVYASSGNGWAGVSYPTGGLLMALSADTGAELWRFNPLDHSEGGAMTGIAIDGTGAVFTGVSGLGTTGGTVFAIDSGGTLRWQYRLGGLLEWGHPVIGPLGDLFVAETRRCLFAYQPIESGLCDDVDIDPKLYVIHPGGGGSGGGCSLWKGKGRATVSGGWPTLALLGLGWTWMRKRTGSAGPPSGSSGNTSGASLMREGD